MLLLLYIFEMAEDPKQSPPSGNDEENRKKEWKRKKEVDYSSEDVHEAKYSRSSKRKRDNHRGRRDSKSRSSSKYSDDESDDYSSSLYSESESESESWSGESDSEEEKRRRKRRERRRKRKEKEKKRRRKDKDVKRKKSDKDVKDTKKKKKKKKKKKDKIKGAVTNSWGKYGIIRETDMWNKRPEFTAWLLEVKQVNLESLPNWEEKQMFKEFMEDHNTATFPSSKYYDLDAYHRRKMEKQMKKGSKILETERTIFNDEEQRRQELILAREKQKEEQVELLKHSMQSGMAQAMKEQAQLKEEMAYQYKLGNFEAAAAIQRRLDPDVAM